MTSSDCKKIIEQQCIIEWERIRSEFVPPLTIEDVDKTKAKNWRRISKETKNLVISRVFDCRSFDDQLRAYVDWNEQSKQITISIETE